MSFIHHGLLVQQGSAYPRKSCWAHMKGKLRDARKIIKIFFTITEWFMGGAEGAVPARQAREEAHHWAAERG